MSLAFEEPQNMTRSLPPSVNMSQTMASIILIYSSQRTDTNRPWAVRNYFWGNQNYFTLCVEINQHYEQTKYYYYWFFAVCLATSLSSRHVVCIRIIIWRYVAVQCKLHIQVNGSSTNKKWAFVTSDSCLQTYTISTRSPTKFFSCPDKAGAT